MATVSKVKSKRNLIPKRQLTRRKFVEPNDDKEFSLVSDDYNRTGHRNTKRVRSNKNIRMGKFKTPDDSSNLQACVREGIISIKSKHREKDVYISDDNQIYHIGDSVYVQSDTISTPYFIGLIQDFKTTRKEDRLVEFQWFYRPSEVPASVLDSLMQDRIIQSRSQDQTISPLLHDPQVRTRELFRCGSSNNGENFNLTSATLIKGKCSVLTLTEIINLKDYTSSEDSFFCILGFDRITRRLSDFKGEIRVGPSHQASLPEIYLEDFKLDTFQGSDLLWNPVHFEDSELQMYLKASRSVAMHAGWCIRGRIEDGLLAMQSDSLTQQSFDLLHKSDYCTRTALKQLVDFPNAYDMIYEKTWSRDEIKNFQKGIKKFGKQFTKIRAELLPKKKFGELVSFYYFWKKSPSGLANRNMRKSRKSVHLKKNHSDHSLPSPCLADLFVDVTSADECDPVEDTKFVGTVENTSYQESKYYICQHCYCSTSLSWHHGGVDNTFLCDNCRVYYCKYGQMRKIHSAIDTPLHILKDPNHLELIKQINEGRYSLQDKIFDHQRDFSDLSESSEYESNLSDVEKLDPDYLKVNSNNEFNELVNRRKSKDILCNPNLAQGNKIATFSSNTSSTDLSHKELPEDEEHSNVLDCLNLKNQSQIYSTMLNLQIPGNSVDVPNARELSFCNLHSPLQDNSSDMNTSFLKSLLQSSDEKSLNIRSQIKVIVHDECGMEISSFSYEDDIEDCDSNSTSEPSSPLFKNDFVLFKPGSKHGAARLDYIPKSNFNDLIIKRKHLLDAKDLYQSNDNQGRNDSKLKENSVKSQNMNIEKVSPTPFPHISIIPTTHVHSYPSNISALPSNVSHYSSSNNQSSPVLPIAIGTAHSESTNLIYGNSNSSFDQFDKESALYSLDQSNILKHISNTNNPFGNQLILPQSIGSNSNTLLPPTHIGNIINTNPDSVFQAVLTKQDALPQPALHFSDSNIPITSISDILPTNSNTCLPSRSLPSASNIYLSNIPSHINLDTCIRGINQGVFHQTLQNNQLQPQIPRPNQLEPVSNSQLQSISNNMLTNNNELQLSSQPNATNPCTTLPQLNNLHTLMNNNILLAPIQENRLNNLHSNPVSTGNLLDSIPCNLGQNKQSYQQYLTFLHSQLYSQQLHAFLLSQMQSPTQSLHAQIQAQVAQSPLQLQLSQIPSQILSAQNQASVIRPQSHSLSLPGFIPYNNEILHQLSNFSFANERDQNQVLPKNTEKK